MRSVLLFDVFIFFIVVFFGRFSVLWCLLFMLFRSQIMLLRFIFLVLILALFGLFMLLFQLFWLFFDSFVQFKIHFFVLTLNYFFWWIFMSKMMLLLFVLMRMMMMLLSWNLLAFIVLNFMLNFNWWFLSLRVGKFWLVCCIINVLMGIYFLLFVGLLLFLGFLLDQFVNSFFSIGVCSLCSFGLSSFCIFGVSSFFSLGASSIYLISFFFDSFFSTFSSSTTDFISLIFPRKWLLTDSRST